MEAVCNHLEDDMEHLLLDDENVNRACLKCRKNIGEHVHSDLSSGKLIIEDSGFYDNRTDNSEDSPLLINVNVSYCFSGKYNLTCPLTNLRNSLQSGTNCITKFVIVILFV